MSKRLLLVEDHADSRNVTAMVLRKAGYEVVAVATAAEAIGVCGEQPFSLFLGDIDLPDGNGYELMKELAERCHIKGIALTGYGYERDIANARDAGFSAHLLKPVDLDVLVKTVGNVLEASAS